MNKREYQIVYSTTPGCYNIQHREGANVPWETVKNCNYAIFSTKPTLKDYLSISNAEEGIKLMESARVATSMKGQVAKYIGWKP